MLGYCSLHAMPGLTGASSLVLAASLRHNSRLEALDIGGNDLGDDAKKLFLGLLRDSQVSALRT